MMDQKPSSHELNKEYDVIIVGASCAGLYAAQLLAEQGLRVVVYERQLQLGETGRTWIVTDELKRILGFVPVTAIVHQVDIMELNSKSQATEVRLETPDLIVERAVMQLLLAERAQAAGAELHLGCNVRRMNLGKERVEAEIKAGSGENPAVVFRACARVLIGADGVKSVIARLAGARPQNTVPVVQARVRLPAGYESQRVRVWFDRRRTRFFYWLIPESAEYGVAGLVAESPTDTRHLLDEFLAQHQFQPIAYQGANIPLHQPLRQIEWRRGGARVLLIGDAGAHVKVTTVGGLVSGLWGARAAATSVLKGTAYSWELLGLTRELYLHDLIRWILDRFTDEAYDYLLQALSEPLRRLLARRNRDSMSLATWTLLASQPVLIFLAVKAILTAQRESPIKPAVKSRESIATD